MDEHPDAEEPVGPSDHAGAVGPGGGAGTSDAGRGDAVRNRPKGFEAAKVHVTLVAVLALCGLAFWFELGRALGGNGLSWAYVVEWPIFAVFAVYMWWSVLGGGRTLTRRKGRAGPAPRVVDPKYLGMLEAWQAHQHELQASRAEAERSDPPGVSPHAG